MFSTARRPEGVWTHLEDARVGTAKPVLLLAVALLCGRVQAADKAFAVTGMGGAGGMYTPSVSPYDPNLMFISCDMSGSYRSLDGGKHWELIHCEQISGSRGCRPTFFPGGVLWASGPTVKVSRDKGATWEPLTEGPPPWGSVAVTVLAPNPATHRGLLFVGTDTGVWRTRLGSEGWEQCLSGKCYDIAPMGDEIYVALQAGDKVFWRSLDYGESWEAVPVPQAKANPLTSITAGAGKGPRSLFATVPQVGTIRSVGNDTECGETWEVVHEFKGQNDVLMTSNQANVAYSVSRREVFRTTDGGETWTNCFRMTGDNPNVERSWVQTEIKWGYSISPLGLGVNPGDVKLVMVSTQGDFYISRNGGESWYQSMNEPVGVKPGDPGYRYKSTGLEVTSSWRYYFDPSDHNRRYIAYTDIGFARSVDAGETWTYSARGCPWSNTFYELAFDPHVKGKMYAATSNRHDIPHWTHVSSNTGRHAGGVCVSEDGGISWKVLGTGQPKLPCTSICIDPESPRDRLTLYATYFEGGVYKSTDSGKTWVKKSNGLGNPGNLHALQVEVHPKTGDLYCSITAHRHGSDFPVPGGLWKSTDGGETWTDLTSELRLAWPANFAVHPENPDIIYLAAATIPGGRQGGLYKTADGGKTWTRLLRDEDFAKTGGQGYVHVLYVNLHPDNPDYVYLGTAGHGLWVSQDAGKTWQRFEVFPFASVTNVTFDPQDTEVMHVATFGGGVWEGHYLP